MQYREDTRNTIQERIQEIQYKRGYKKYNTREDTRNTIQERIQEPASPSIVSTPRLIINNTTRQLGRPRSPANRFRS